jgi:predicted ribosome quality control (RQC) complex YloA/Tae2 family protein
MYFDSFTTAAIAAELNTLLGGRVQAIVEPDELSVGLEIYAQRKRHYLLISAQPRSARCHLVPARLRRGVEHASPLGLLLNKYVEGARLSAVAQPPWERILWLDFSGPQGDTRLIAEIMDQRSNIVLTVGDDILDCIKRVWPEKNRYRTLLPGQPYTPPPPQRKLPPDRLTIGLLEEFLQQTPDTPAWEVLVERLAGISPLLAREVVYRACDEPEAPAFDLSAERLYAVFSALLSEAQLGNWTPCVIPSEEGDGYRAYAAYALTHLAPYQPVESISEAITVYYGAPVGLEAYGTAKTRVQMQIDSAIERVRHKLAALEREALEAGKIDLLRKQGELILAYGPGLAPGQRQLVAQYAPDEPPLIIELDPELSPVENAKRCFERYEKAKRAAADVPALLANAEGEIAYLEQLATDLKLAENWPEIDAVREALQEAGYWRGERMRGPRGGKPGIRRFSTPDGFVILVGRNAGQNHALVTERSTPADWWLHARGVPGSHVIVKNDGRPIPEQVIQKAAQLAAYYSAKRDEASVEVDVTERRYVRPIKGGKPGQVTYKHERTLTVQPSKDI